MDRMTRWLLWVAGCAMSLQVQAAAPAEVQLLQAPAWRLHGAAREPLRPGMPLASGDRILTGAGARVVIALAEGSTVKLGENADLALAELVPPSRADGVYRGFLDVVKGAFRFTTTVVGRKRQIAARISTATIGIRGTDVWGKTEPGRDFAVLLEGHITIDHGGQQYDLATPNSLFVAPRGGAALPVAPVDPDELARWAQETEPQAAQGVSNVHGGYRLYLASYGNATAADALVASLGAAGYGAVTESAVAGGRQWQRVVLRGFASRADAQAVETLLKRDFGLTTTWIEG